MTQKRLTSQKQIILDYLHSVKTHPSAEAVYKDVRKKLPAISKGTVYRILNDFASDGTVLEISGEVKRFDGDVKPHDHFICKKCNKIYDIFNQKHKQRRKIKNIGIVESQQVYFYGVCNECNK